MPTADGRLTAAEVAQIAALVQAQAAVRQRLRRTAVAAALAPFEAIADWWSPTHVRRAIADVLRVLQPNQRQAARITDAYLARVLTVMTGRTVRPTGVVDVARLRRRVPAAPAAPIGRRAAPEPGPEEELRVRGEPEPEPTRRADAPPSVTRREDAGDLPDIVLPRAEPGQQLPADQVVDPAEAFERVAATYRKAIVMDDATPEKARERALRRVRVMAETEMLLAIREQVRRTLVLRGVRQYRRIPRPELSETGPCGLCIVAADRIYTIEDLLPIHDRCVCEVLPVIGEMDPGLNLNFEDLEALYREAGGTAGKLLKRIRVDIVEHGELGPVLIDGRHQFRGPRQVAAQQSVDPATRARMDLEYVERRLAELEERARRGGNVERSLRWHRERARELRRAGAARAAA